MCHLSHVSLVWASHCQLTLLTGRRFEGIDQRTTCRFCFCRSDHILSTGCNGWNCAARQHKIYLHSSASQNSTISFWLSGSSHQKAVNLNSFINCSGKKIDFSSFCLNHRKQHNFSDLPPSAYSLDILESMKEQVLLPNANSNIDHKRTNLQLEKFKRISTLNCCKQWFSSFDLAGFVAIVSSNSSYSVG